MLVFISMLVVIGVCFKHQNDGLKIRSAQDLEIVCRFKPLSVPPRSYYIWYKVSKPDSYCTSYCYYLRQGTWLEFFQSVRPRSYLWYEVEVFEPKYFTSFYSLRQGPGFEYSADEHYHSTSFHSLWSRQLGTKASLLDKIDADYAADHSYLYSLKQDYIIDALYDIHIAPLAVEIDTVAYVDFSLPRLYDNHMITPSVDCNSYYTLVTYCKTCMIMTTCEFKDGIKSQTEKRYDYFAVFNISPLRNAFFHKHTTDFENILKVEFKKLELPLRGDFRTLSVILNHDRAYTNYFDKMRPDVNFRHASSVWKHDFENQSNFARVVFIAIGLAISGEHDETFVSVDVYYFYFNTGLGCCTKKLQWVS